MAEDQDSGGGLSNEDEFALSFDVGQFHHTYHNEYGSVSLRAIRNITFFDESFVEYGALCNGIWKSAAAKDLNLLYSLPKVISSNSVIVTQNERLADLIRKSLHGTSAAGWAVTCWPEPINTWQPSFSNYFYGKQAFLVPENTNASVERLRTAANALMGVTATTKMVRLSDIASVHKYLVTDTAAAGQQLLSACEVTAPWTLEMPKNSFSVKSVAELMTKVPASESQWLIEGLLPSSGLGLIVGPPKDGKSTLARQAAAAIADGEDFLGRKVIQGPVLYISMEETAAKCAEHLQKLGLKTSTNIFIHHGIAPSFDEMRAMIKEKQARLLILDTLFKVVPVKAVGNYVCVNNLLQPILQAAHEVGAFVLGIHHLNQSGSTLGGTGVESAVDQIIYFRREAEKGIMSTKPRYGEAWEPTTLVFDKEQQRYSLGKPHLAFKRDEMAAEMLAFIKGNSGVTQYEILSATEGRRSEKLKAFELIKSVVVRHGTGRRGDPYRYSVQEQAEVMEATANTQDNNVPDGDPVLKFQFPTIGNQK